MAKFCRYCGAPLEEEQVCSCRSIPVTEAQEQAPAEPQAPFVAAVKTVVYDLLGYIKTPKAVTEQILSREKGIVSAAVFAVIYAIVMFLYVFRLTAQLGEGILKLWSDGVASIVGGLMGEVSRAVAVEYPVGIVLLAGVLIAAADIAVSASAVFLWRKFGKTAVDFKKLVMGQAVETVYLTVTLLVSLFASFISWKLQILLLIPGFVLWIVKLCDGIYTEKELCPRTSVKNMGVLVGIISASFVVMAAIVGALVGWSFGQLVVEGRTLSELVNGIGRLF